MNQQVCSESTHNFFELISRHITDKYYNILYVEANKRRNASLDSRSMTDLYCDVILHYLNVFKKNNHSRESKKYYMMDLKNIIDYYNTYSNKDLTTSQFTEIFLMHMFHEKLYAHFSNNTKDTIMFKVMSDIILIFTNKLKNNLSFIIDTRNKENYSKIKQIMMEVLILEKQTLFNDYVSIVTKNKIGDTPNIIQDKLKNELMEIGKKHSELQVKYNKLLDIAKRQQRENEKLQKEIIQKPVVQVGHSQTSNFPQDIPYEPPIISYPIDLYTSTVETSKPTIEKKPESNNQSSSHNDPILTKQYIDISKKIDNIKYPQIDIPDVANNDFMKKFNQHKERVDNELKEKELEEKELEEDEDDDEINQSLIQSIREDQMARSSMCLPSSRSLEKQFNSYF